MPKDSLFYKRIMLLNPVILLLFTDNFYYFGRCRYFAQNHSQLAQYLQKYHSQFLYLLAAVFRIKSFVINPVFS